MCLYLEPSGRQAETLYKEFHEANINVALPTNDSNQCFADRGPLLLTEIG